MNQLVRRKAYKEKIIGDNMENGYGIDWTWEFWAWAMLILIVVSAVWLFRMVMK